MQVQFEKIPQFLKANGQFCTWKYELRDGNQTKVPYMPGTTRKASVNDPTSFTAFDTAASATGYDGIGIWVSGRIVGIDLDHCVEYGKLLPWAQTIVDKFSDTYIEVYIPGHTNRFLTVTGNTITDADVWKQQMPSSAARHLYATPHTTGYRYCRSWRKLSQ